MTGEELYKEIGGNYDEVIIYLRNDENILKFAKMFLADTGFPELEEAMKNEDYQAAFQASHKLKGVCMNMSYEQLFKQIKIVTELLRNESNIPEAKKEFVKAKAIYEHMVDVIQKNVV